jgi:hypothetical protein
MPSPRATVFGLFGDTGETSDGKKGKAFEFWFHHSGKICSGCKITVQAAETVAPFGETLTVLTRRPQKQSIQPK